MPINLPDELPEGVYNNQHFDYLRENIHLFPHLQALNDTIKELFDETDRGASIFAASMLDQKLKAIVDSYLIEGPQAKNLLRQSNAPIGTFSARMNLAAALGLITSGEYQDCDTIRRIRNDFAHKFEFSFSFQDERVSALCRNLDIYRVSINSDYDYRKLDSRLLFTLAACTLFWRWRDREKHVATIRRQAIDWEPLIWGNGQQPSPPSS